MAAKRTYRPRKAKKRYSPQEKLSYHYDRDLHPARHGLKYGSGKHLYSYGFADAFSGRNNASGCEKEFGKKSVGGYRLGYARGEKEATKYFKATGKQPSSLKAEIQQKKLRNDDFARDSKGRIKGSYTPDGFFEPD